MHNYPLRQRIRVRPELRTSDVCKAREKTEICKPSVLCPHISQHHSGEASLTLRETLQLFPRPVRLAQHGVSARPVWEARSDRAHIHRAVPGSRARHHAICVLNPSWNIRTLDRFCAKQCVVSNRVTSTHHALLTQFLSGAGPIKPKTDQLALLHCTIPNQFRSTSWATPKPRITQG